MLIKPVNVVYVPATAGHPSVPPFSFCVDDGPPDNGNGGSSGSSGGGSGCVPHIVDPNCGPSGCFPIMGC